MCIITIVYTRWPNRGKHCTRLDGWADGRTNGQLDGQLDGWIDTIKNRCPICCCWGNYSCPNRVKRKWPLPSSLMWTDWLSDTVADVPWQSADHLSAGTGAAPFQMPWCGVPRQWAQCWAIIPCVSRDWPPIWRGPLVCIHATLRSIIRWACQFPSQSYLDAINTMHPSSLCLSWCHPSSCLQPESMVCSLPHNSNRVLYNQSQHYG